MKSVLKISLAVICLSSMVLGQNDFEMVRPDEVPGGTPQVIGADPVSPSVYPATFIFQTPDGGCTSTVIGAQVILTAAHCVEDGATGTITLNETTVQVDCSHHPDYFRDFSADFALCFLSSALPSLPFEQVNASLATPRVGKNVQLVGYGCREEGGVDSSFGVLHHGPAGVTAIPIDEHFNFPQGGGFYIATQGGAALCYGDSGGGSYAYTDPDKTKRVLIGVNSRGDISTRSWLSSTATPSFLSWAVAWSTEKSAKICGLDDDATGCRR